ncbi:MAG: hypothetical protein K1X70_09605 [Leptospirales bacterium]|nr:hypothetical protein [Leptospirales bacterium]
MKGKKTGGRNFPKGVSGNPKGRPPLSDVERAVREATRRALHESWEKVLSKNSMDDLISSLSKRDSPPIFVALAKAVQVSARTGDFSRLDRIMDRIIGRPKQSLELAGSEDNPLSVVVESVRNRLIGGSITDQRP